MFGKKDRLQIFWVLNIESGQNDPKATQGLKPPSLICLNHRDRNCRETDDTRDRNFKIRHYGSNYYITGSVKLGI